MAVTSTAYSHDESWDTWSTDCAVITTQPFSNRPDVHMTDKHFDSIRCPHHTRYPMSLWFVWKEHFVLFTQSSSCFEIIVLHHRGAPPIWTRIKLKLKDVDKSDVVHSKSLMLIYAEYIRVASVFDDKKQILYVFCKHYSGRSQAMIEVGMTSRECRVSPLRHQNIIESAKFGGFSSAMLINDKFHLLLSDGVFVWRRDLRGFTQCYEFGNIHIECNGLYHHRTDDVRNDFVIRWNDDMLTEYHIGSRTSSSNTVAMPLYRMRHFGIVSCFEGRLIVMIGGEYEYGILSDDIWVYDVQRKLLGKCLFRSPIKGQCIALTVQECETKAALTLGFIRMFTNVSVPMDLLDVLSLFYIVQRVHLISNNFYRSSERRLYHIDVDDILFATWPTYSVF